MEKASGVYLTITDNSFLNSGTEVMKVIVPMLTNKGKMGITRVTANTFKDLVGYDLDYNSNYYGLQKLLENMAYLDVWRINQGAKMANAYFVDKDSEKTYDNDCETFEEITMRDPTPLIGVANKYVGDWQTTAVRFSPTETETTVSNANASISFVQEVVLEDVSKTETRVYDNQTIYSGCIIYNSSNNAIVGVIKEDNEGNFKVYKVVDAEIIDDEIIYRYTNTWFDGTKFYGSLMNEMEEPSGEAGEPVELGTVRNTVYDVVNDTWLLGTRIMDKTGAVIVPEGTAGTSTPISKAYVAGSGDIHLREGSVYLTEDGVDFYIATELGNTFVSTNKELISDSVIAADLLTLWTNDAFGDLEYVPYTVETPTGFYQKQGEYWFKVGSFTVTSIVTDPNFETNTDIITALENATDVTISYIQYSEVESVINNSVGTAEWDDNGNLTLTLYGLISKDTFWNIYTIPNAIVDWTMTVAKYDNNEYTVQNTYDFSTDTASDIYWKEVDFGDVQLFLSGSIPGTMQSIRNYFILEGGSNGNAGIVAIDIDTSLLDTCGDNILLFNGITNYKIINRIAAKCQQIKIHAFCDAPAYTSYIDVEQWSKRIIRGEYVAIGARPDQTENSNGETIYIYPSVNYGCIYADMMASYGSLCYPPAGPTYGIISADDLLECDYGMYANELKTNRINWQQLNDLGTMMWEQRTTYALNTDLSYIAPVFIVDAVAERIVTFERQFNFRYMTRTDLLNQQSGLNAIFEEFVNKNFIFQFTVAVPSWEVAQRQGRTLKIPLQMMVAKDSEVIELELELTNNL